MTKVFHPPETRLECHPFSGAQLASTAGSQGELGAVLGLVNTLGWEDRGDSRFAQGCPFCAKTNKTQLGGACRNRVSDLASIGGLCVDLYDLEINNHIPEHRRAGRSAALDIGGADRRKVFPGWLKGAKSTQRWGRRGKRDAHPKSR
jgi:hypothetical protein